MHDYELKQWIKCDSKNKQFELKIHSGMNSFKHVTLNVITMYIMVISKYLRISMYVRMYVCKRHAYMTKLEAMLAAVLEANIVLKDFV